MPSARYDRLDALRGAAIVWMTAFHFCFDLNHFRWIRQDFNRDPVWTWQRTAIVSLFLFCAGLSQSVAWAQRQSWPRFWRRWAQIAGCAVLVSIGSWFMFPSSWIHFGVLHGIAAMLVIVRLTAGWGRWLWLAGAVALLMPHLASQIHAAWPGFEALNRAPLNVLGLVTRKPITEDYVPVFPWLGVLWWGMAAGQWLLDRRPRVLAGSLPGGARPLAWLGRWSLTWYMVHQPVMIGALTVLTPLLLRK
jgi:uncharacterized membrane protein